MFSSVRRSARAWGAGLVLFIALVAMVVTGFGTGGMGGLGGTGASSGSTLASVDGFSLTDQEVNDVLNREFSQARQQQPTLGMAQFLAGAFDPIVDQLVMALAVQAFGDDQGLVVSPRMVDREIVNVPAFRNFAGQFDEATFRQQLNAQNITEAQLRQDISRSLMQRQLLGPVARGGAIPEGIAREYANLLLERRRGSVGVVPASVFAAGITPTPAQVAEFYRSNPARFTIPERRVIRFAVIGPDQVAGAARATDQEIEAFYRQNQATYGARQTRNLEAVVLQDQAAAQRFAQRVRGGATFAAVAQEAGFSAADINVANQTREQFAGASSAEVAQAVFSAAQGALVGPIRSPLGFHLVRVAAVNETPARPLNAVRPEIAKAIEDRKRGEALANLVARVEDQLTEGTSLEEVARSANLQLVTTPAVTAQGQAWGQAYQAPPELQALLTSAFEIDPEEPEPVVEQLEANSRFALLAVDRVLPAAPPPLAQIQDQVRSTLVQVRALELARRAAHQIAARINGGMPAAQAFAQAQPRIPAPQNVALQRLDISRTGEQAPPPLIALFSLAQGRAHVLSAPNGAGWFVVHHEQRTPGNASSQPAPIASTRREFSASMAEEIAQQFARSVQIAAEVKRNPEAIQQTRQRLLGNAGE